MENRMYFVLIMIVIYIASLVITHREIGLKKYFFGNKGSKKRDKAAIERIEQIWDLDHKGLFLSDKINNFIKKKGLYNGK
jgi:hypothetical protein